MASLSVQSEIVAAAAAGLLLAVWLLGVMLWARRRARKARMLKSRIGLTPPESPRRQLSLWIDGKRISTAVPGRSAANLARRLGAFYRRTGWHTPPGLFLGQIGLLMLLAFLLGLFLAHNVVIALLATALAPWLAWILAKRQIDKRQNLFEQQFVDALELGARSLRAGHPFSGSLRLIAREIPAPVGDIFADICQQQDFGVSTDDAIQKAAEQTAQANFRILATAISIHHKSGGSLADMMERLAVVMRDRVRLDRRIHVLTAQTNFSKRILLLMPVAMFVLLNFINPRYMGPLYHTRQGQEIMVVSAVALVIGAKIMNVMAKIDY